jgi:hypothetical protein
MEVYGASGNLSNPEATKLPATATALSTQRRKASKVKAALKQKIDFQLTTSLSPQTTPTYTRKYKRLQLVFFSESGAGDWPSILSM